MSTYKLRTFDDEGIPRTVKVLEEGAGISIVPAGTGDCCSKDGAGVPILLEHYEGKWVLHVWADINEEDATHRIDLTQALESNRREI